MLPFGLDWKVLAAVAAFIIGTAGFVPYFWEIFKRRTQPHIYTWLIWCLTQGIGTAGILYGRGGLVGYSLVFGTCLVFLVFLLSFKYGTKNITRSDAVILVFAVLAIIVWWQLHNPVLAVLMVCVIDGVGYLPTYRKLYAEPWSEHATTWVLFIISYIFALLALDTYNLLTVPYMLLCAVANLLLVVLALIRRRTIPKPL